jgi:hypothetical protein
VRGTDSTLVTLDVVENETIDSLKNQIQAKPGAPAVQQILIYTGRPLVKGNVLDYGVQKNCTTNLAVAFAGG